MGHAIINLDGKPVEFIVEKVRDVVTKMTGNVNFTTPNPTLTVVTAANDKLEQE